MESIAPVNVRLRVNAQEHVRSVAPRRLLSDFLREDLGLTGTHVGCEYGVCGACTILLNGQPARSCLMFAVMADGAEITTVEGLAPAPGTDTTSGWTAAPALHPIQEEFSRHHGLQCGYCTPGMLMTTVGLLQRNAHPTRSEIRAAISGNLCRCTGYQGIVDAIAAAAERLGTDQ